MVMVTAFCALAILTAWNSQLIAFTVVFLTARFFAFTASSMLMNSFFSLFYYFRVESFRISRQNFFSSLINNVFLTFQVGTVNTTTFLTAYLPFSKAFTVHFKTFWLLTTAFKLSFLLCRWSLFLELTKLDFFNRIFVHQFISSLVAAVGTRRLIVFCFLCVRILPRNFSTWWDRSCIRYLKSLNSFLISRFISIRGISVMKFIIIRK